MATAAERLGIVETKVENLNDKLDDIKLDVREVHDCVHKTGESINASLKAMREESTNQHTELANKVKALEKIRDKWQQYVMILLAFGAGTGWMGHLDLAKIIKFAGL